MRVSRWLDRAVGLLLGILLSVSAFEVIHRTVEIEGSGMCATIYDELTKQWNPDFAYHLKVTYKAFAWPMKTLWIAISERQIAWQGVRAGSSSPGPGYQEDEAVVWTMREMR